MTDKELLIQIRKFIISGGDTISMIAMIDRVLNEKDEVVNKTRAKALSSLRSEIENIKSQIETEREAEAEAFENLSETARDGDKGQAMESAVDSMEQAISNLDEALENLEAAENSVV